MGYPEQLERLLNASGPVRYQVRNHGFPNANSSIVADNFPAWLEADRPHIVFAMIGETNKWNKYGLLNFRRRVDQSRDTFLLSLFEPFRSLRLYRLAELFLHRSESWNRTDAELFSAVFKSVRKVTDEDKNILSYLWIGGLETGNFTLRHLAPEARAEAVQMLRFLARREPSNPIALRMLAEVLWGSRRGLSDFPKVLETAIELHGTTFNYPLWRIFREIQAQRPELLDDRLQKLRARVEALVSPKKLAEINAFILNHGKTQSDRPTETTLEMLKYHPTHPLLLLNLTSTASEAELPAVTQAVIRSLELNPLTPSVYYINNLSKRVAKRPELKALLETQLLKIDKKFGAKNPAKIFSDERIDEEWLTSDIERIIAAARSYGAKVVIQTYPPLRRAGARPVDLSLRKWWGLRKERDRLEFHDVTAELTQEFASDGNKDRFYSQDMGPDDQHLNADGYREIARLMVPFVTGRESPAGRQ